jgi:plasmid stabilization system protein ParE
MKNKRLRVHPNAEQEYLAALAWYRERSPTAAEEFESAVEQAIDRIRESPQRWPTYFGNFRKYTLRQFPFAVIYEELLTETTILAIAHGRRRPGYWKGRQ